MDFSQRIQPSSTLALNYYVTETTTFGPIDITPQGDFTLGSGSTCTGTLPAQSSCVVNVTFTPLAREVHTGEVEITSSSGKVLVATSPGWASAQPDVRR